MTQEEFKTIKFNKQKAAAAMSFSSDFISQLEPSFTEDLMNRRVTARIDAYFLERTIEEKEITYYLDKPSFLDWLLGRRKKATVKVSVKDILKNHPVTKGCSRFYFIDKQD